VAHRHIVCGIVLAAAALSAAAPRAQTVAPASAGHVLSPVHTSQETLQARLETIERRSALWRAALQALRGTGRRVIVLTPNQVAVADSLADATPEPFDEGVIAAVAPVPERGSHVQTVLVVVNLPLIEALHARRNSLPGELHMDLDRILAHEIYGHAIPYLLAGDLSGRCPDPVAGQIPADACAIRRENAIREELRMGRRTTYGLQDLLLTLSQR
jgi:hypothetical protein